MSLSAHTDSIRQQMPATTSQIYLNAGTFGPLSAPVVVAMQERMQDEWKEGRLGSKGFGTISKIYDQARSSVARLLNAEKSEITLTDNTGEGMNIISFGFNWQPNDEVITTNHEHFSALAPLYHLRDRLDVRIQIADLGPNAELPAAEAIQPLITPRTRLIVLSHVTWTTGSILDIQSVAQVAHAHDIPVLVDGAQSAGNIAIDMKMLDVDFYAIPMQKWLCGPDGTGALYVRSSSLDLVTPTYVGYFSFLHDESAEWKFNPDARRFELGGRQTASIAGQNAALTWLEQTVGYSWLHTRIAELNLYAYNTLKEVPGLTILTPQPGVNGILTFAIAGQSDSEIVKVLQERYNIIIRNIPSHHVLRLSTGFYNTEEEIDTVAHALKHL